MLSMQGNHVSRLLFGIRLLNSDTPANWKSGNFRHTLRDLTRSITDRIIVVIDDDGRITQPHHCGCCSIRQRAHSITNDWTDLVGELIGDLPPLQGMTSLRLTAFGVFFCVNQNKAGKKKLTPHLFQPPKRFCQMRQLRTKRQANLFGYQRLAKGLHPLEHARADAGGAARACGGAHWRCKHRQRASLRGKLTVDSRHGRNSAYRLGPGAHRHRGIHCSESRLSL